MNTAVRVGGFALTLAAVLLGAVGAGRAVGPVGPVGPPEQAARPHDAEHASTDQAVDDHGGADQESAGGHAGHAHGAAPAAVPPGLAISQHGYSLQLLTDPAPGRQVLRLSILGPDGQPVTDYDVQHEKELHLIVVRRDLRGFQHVHPTRDAAGVWSVPVHLDPGAWRVFADVKPAGADPVVLGADLLVPGDHRPAPLGADNRADSVDGYDVTLGGSLPAGKDTTLALTVSRDGRPVDDLQPYLGAYGHLVALRAGDLAYLHVHPDDGPPGPAITFQTAFPSPGRYRLFLDFQHGGVVRTAQFTVTVGDSGAGAASPSHSGDGHDHAH